MGTRPRGPRNYLRDDILRYLTLLLLCFLFSTGCSRYEDPAVAQARVRNMQTRTFVGAELTAVMKQTIATFQDEGFMVKHANTDVGLITAELDTNIERLSSKFWAHIFSGRQARWRKHSVIEITSNITEEVGKTKLRINLLVRVFDNLGRVVDVHSVEDEKVYADFFSKVQRGLVMNQGL